MWDAKMADEENIRHCVRDKFEQRMRNLIRSTAASITRDLDQNLGGGLLPSRSRSCILVVCSTSKSATFSGALSGIGSGSSSLGVTKGSSPVPGHSWRFKKSKAVKIQSIPRTVWLLDKPSEDVEIGTDGEYEDYAVTVDMVLLKREFDPVNNHREENIRRELEGIFNWKFSGISL